MTTLNNVNNIKEFLDDPYTYKGRNTINNFRYTGDVEETKYYKTDEYIICEETDRNQITIFRKDNMSVESWYDMWNIKNKIWGDEVLAVEIYPKRSELIDGCNQRHLFKLNIEGKIDFGNASQLNF